jgi:integrase
LSKLLSRNPITLEVLPLKEILTLKPADDMVVTITKDGSPLSRFRDDIWNYSATSASYRVLNFRTKIESIIPVDGAREASVKSLASANEFLKTLTLHWVSVIGGCSMSKLNGDVSAASFLVRFCLDSGIPVRKIFSTPDAIDFLTFRASTPKQTGLLLGKIQRFADTATVLGNNIFWQELSPSVEFQKRLKRARKKFPETTDSVQTLLIPSEIYQGVLKKTIEDLDLFLEHEKAIKLVFSLRAFARDKVIGLDQSQLPNAITRKQQKERIAYSWKKLLRENIEVSAALKELYEEGISKSENWAGVYNNLKRWQFRCAILISAFTGMRMSELLAIPLNGLKTISTDSGTIPVVWSTTTKLEVNGAPRFTKWVTSSVVETAFKVARIIAEGALAWSGCRRILDVNEQKTPLFLSVEHGTNGIPHPKFHYTTTVLNAGRDYVDLYKEELEVSAHDIEETSWFLYGENVPNVIKVGKTWPLAFHQFRRSLAVYAAASGIVSYPVLKNQLKHMSMMMTVYYSDSNSRAINILGNEAEVKAMQAEWADAKARVEADNLYKLLESDQPLAGIAGKRLRSQKDRGELPQFLESRTSTKQAVKKGKFRYRPTLVGGCVSVVPCNKGAGVLASACISCENAVFLPGSRAALEQTKEFYEAELAEGAPKRARQEYETNIKQIDSFLQSLVETVEVT